MERNLLVHAAIIPDGSRRAERKNGWTPGEGHLRGAQLIEPIVEEAAREGIEAVTIFAFAKKNIKRPHEEWVQINGVFRYMLNSPTVERMFENNVIVNTIGEIGIFDGDIQERVVEIQEQSLHNSGIIVTFALNYDGRAEIVRAANLALQQRSENERMLPLTEEDIDNNLYTAGLPELGLMIRTGGMRRLSGFLPWQSVDTEIYNTDTLWPEYTIEEFKHTTEWFREQQRNFGK